MAARLTEKGVEALRPRKGHTRFKYDSDAVGLGLKVLPNGAKVWFCQLIYPGKAGQSKRWLGAWPAMGVSAAREKARAWHSLVSSGIDPAAIEAEETKKAEAARQAAAEKKANTFANFAEQRYIKFRRNRRAEQDAREIRRLLVSEWGERPIDEIAPRDVRQVIYKIKVRAPYDARNAWTHAVGIFKQAVHEELIAASPCASLDKKLVFKDVKIASRQRYLSEEETLACWRAAGRLGYPAGPAIRLLLLLGARNGEVTRANWSEFSPHLRRLIREARAKNTEVNWSAVDGSAKVWVVPPERFKSDAEHHVPLSDEACAIIETLPRFSKCDAVFTTTGDTSFYLGNKIKRDLDRRMLRTLRALARRRGDEPKAVKLPTWKFHDLRRTVRTSLSALGVADHVAEMVLGHGRRGLQRVYDQHRYLPEIRDALEKWAKKLRTIVGGTPTAPASNVVNLRRKRP